MLQQILNSDELIGKVIKEVKYNFYPPTYCIIVKDEEGEPTIELRWLVTKGEVKAAIYGHIDCRKVSESWGRVKLQGELKKLLNVN